MTPDEFKALGKDQAQKIRTTAERYRAELAILIVAADILDNQKRVEYIASFLAMPDTIVSFANEFEKAIKKAARKAKRK